MLCYRHDGLLFFQNCFWGGIARPKEFEDGKNQDKGGKKSMARLKLDELAGGAAQEKFDRSFSKVAQNLMDVNCPFDKKRAITMQFEFAFKDESREELEVKITSKESLAPQMPIRTQMAIGQDLETKKISVHEYGSNIRQKSPLNTNELEEGSEITLADGSVVDTDTGEVVNYRDINRLKAVQ